MPTFYLDFDNGNDNHAGTSFDPVSSTDGRITGTTFTSASAQFISSLSNNYANYSSIQYLSIFNGTSYVTYKIDNILNDTSLQISAISGGSALANQSVDRQYYIGGRWKTFNTGATAARIQPGDEIRVMASEGAQSIGNATWLDENLRSTTNISSSTNATPISITSTNHGNSTGDTVVITGHAVNTNANGTWEITVTGANTFTLNGSTGNGVGGATGTVRNRNNAVIRLPSPLNQNIASCGNRGQGRTAWTTADAANIVVTQNTTDFKEGDCSDSIAIGANFTTGKAAYFATGSLNLSGYQQVSFWIKQTAGTIAVAGDISLRLCSDTLGNTPVHTVNIESLLALNSWMSITTTNLSSSLSSNIQSIALYVNVDRGAQTFLLSNIIAVKSSQGINSLNLSNLITLSDNGYNSLISIQSINGSRIMIDGVPNSTPITPPRGNAWNTGVGAYVAETFIVDPIRIPLTNSVNAIVLNEAGTANNYINITGGWDRGSMTYNIGYLNTVLDGRIAAGTAVTSQRAFIYLSGFSFVRFSIGIDAGASSVYNVNQICHCSTVIQGNGSTTNNVYFVCFRAYSNTNVYGGIGPYNTFALTYAESNTNFIPRIYNNNIYQGTSLYNNATNVNTGNSPLGNNKFIGIIHTENIPFFINGGYGLNNQFINCVLYSVDSSAGDLYLYNTAFVAPTEIPMSIACTNARAYSYNHQQVAGNHVIFSDGGRISSNTSIRHTNSGFSWAMAPTSTNRSASYPLYLKLATVAVSANNLVTVKAWMRRSNTGLTMGLRVPLSDYSSYGTGFNVPVPFISTHITSLMTASADTWQEVTLTFTPSSDMVVDIYADAYGGTTYTGYVDDLTITQ